VPISLSAIHLGAVSRNVIYWSVIANREFSVLLFRTTILVTRASIVTLQNTTNFIKSAALVVNIPLPKQLTACRGFGHTLYFLHFGRFSSLPLDL